MEIVIASKNVHKIREFREMLAKVEHVDITSLLNFPDYEPSEEVGKSFEENAKAKATEAAKALKKWVLADDSGLVVPALQGEPGIYSKRYAGSDATDAENRHKILEAMKGKSDLERAAYYECSLVLADPNGQIKKFVRGICEGFLVDEEKGRNGFGYDALFVKHDYDKTFAELEESVKNRISHRSKAIEKILPALETL
ncbi:MAG: RdgB/HAM1 family non-canonical purine NTP pyrophosphatase [Chlamydiota bacterium]